MTIDKTLVYYEICSFGATLTKTTLGITILSTTTKKRDIHLKDILLNGRVL